MQARVDSVPWTWRPLYWLYGYGGGLLFQLYCLLTRLSCRLCAEGTEHLEPGRGHIFAMWHSENIPCFVADLFRRTGGRFILLNHPAWVMKPVHVVLRLHGVERLILGSTGHDGRRAADELAALLRQGGGVSTHINPDGPAGPPRVLKKGVAHLALQSGLAVVPVHFRVSREWRLKSTWDGKRFPLPFGRITTVYGKPIRVTAEEFERVLPVISAGLDGQD